MSIYMLDLVLTDAMLQSVFYHLTCCSVFQTIGINPQGYEGMQTGYINCLMDMFGAADEETVIKTFDQGQSWIQVVDKISEHPDIIKMFNKDAETTTIDDIEDMRELIEQIVNDYLDEHIEEARLAIRSI